MQTTICEECGETGHSANKCPFVRAMHVAFAVTNYKPAICVLNTDLLNVTAKNGFPTQPAICRYAVRSATKCVQLMRNRCLPRKSYPTCIVFVNSPISRVRRLSQHQHKVTPVKISAIFTEDITVTHVHQRHVNEQPAEIPAKQINARLTEIKFDRSRSLSFFATTSGLIVEAAGWPLGW